MLGGDPLGIGLVGLDVVVVGQGVHGGLLAFDEISEVIIGNGTT